MKEPVIRFKGYTDEWEQRKLGEVGNAKSGIGFPDAEQGGVEGIPFFKVSDMNLDGNENELIRANNYVTQEQIKRKRWNVIDDVPAIFFAKVGAAVMLNRKRLVRMPFLLDNNTMAYIFDSNVWDSEFGKALFETIDLTKLTQVGALPSYNASDVEDISIMMPSHKEQSRIGAYFSNLDNLITLHQRKCDDLQEVKKYMLQKMFPRNGEKIPEIRFAGFTDEWEQRKLGDITTKIGSGKTPCGGSEAYVDDGIPLIRSQNVHDDVVDLSDVAYIDEETNKSMENSLVAYNDVLLNITGASIGRSAVYKGSKPANVNQHVCIIRPTEDYSSDFIQMNLASSNGQKQIDSSQAGGAREGLNFRQIGKMEFAFPSVDEQNKIGTYFRNLNNLITLHQCECDALKEVKKFMLQNMFPEG
ncbi:restriction endonuclease subunit S [Selenomonas ruminantium]|uniref:restriction endonuclease subunit S n=1 Tax=Selenomonas ruminantium TaxID=971 RepID=UPI0026ED0AFB|nr:restriction endonuclease subunit S [Selenomonas ruminantium]